MTQLVYTVHPVAHPSTIIKRGDLDTNNAHSCSTYFRVVDTLKPGHMVVIMHDEQVPKSASSEELE